MNETLAFEYDDVIEEQLVEKSAQTEFIMFREVIISVLLRWIVLMRLFSEYILYVCHSRV